MLEIEEPDVTDINFINLKATSVERLVVLIIFLLISEEKFQKYSSIANRF